MATVSAITRNNKKKLFRDYCTVERNKSSVASIVQRAVLLQMRFSGASGWSFFCPDTIRSVATWPINVSTDNSIETSENWEGDTTQCDATFVLKKERKR